MGLEIKILGFIRDYTAVNYTAFSNGHGFDIKKIFYETRPYNKYNDILLITNNKLIINSHRTHGEGGF